MTLELAFVLLCIAQIVHFSNRWWSLSLILLEDFRKSRIRTAVDWRLSGRRRASGRTLLDELLFVKR